MTRYCTSEKKRIEDIKDQVDRYSNAIQSGESSYEDFQNRLKQETKLDSTSQEKFIYTLRTGLRFEKGIETICAEDAVAICYTFVFLALRDLYRFGKDRVRRIQDKVLEYAWMVRRQELHVLEFMKCLQVECGLQYESLDAYEAQHGELQIYGGATA